MGKTLVYVVAAVAALSVRGADVTVVHGSGEQTPKVGLVTREFRPYAPYRCTLRARKLPGTTGSCLCVGLDGANVDLRLTGDWTEETFVVAAPDRKDGAYSAAFGCGLWRVDGDVEVKDLRLEPVTPVYADAEGVPLAAGEMLLGNEFVFSYSAKGENRNHCRSLVRERQVGFNTNRRILSAASEAVFLHEVEGCAFTSADVTLKTDYFRKGALAVEFSADGTDWTTVAVAQPSGAVRRVAAPASFFPRTRFYSRLKGRDGLSLQLHDYQLCARFTGPRRFAKGATLFAEEGGKDVPPKAEVPDIHRSDYGELLPASSGNLGIWRASSGRKVGRLRARPTAQANALVVLAAANETEAAQLVLSPKADLADVVVTVAGDLKGENGGVLSAAQVEIPYVGYVPVSMTTDQSSVPGDYPDPLIPQTGPRRLAGGLNHPYWVRVKVPKGTAKDTYRGEIAIRGRGVDARVPLTVRIWGFELPDVATCRTLFGFYPAQAAQYHGAKTREDRERVAQLYYRAYADYRISPGDGGSYGHYWSVRWDGDEPKFDWTQYDAAIERGISDYRFNALRLSSGLGLGGGDASHRREPEIDGVKEGDPRYEVRLSRFLRGIQDHFEEKGWLDRTFIYCFDEPPERDNAFVMNGFAKLKRFAPKLNRFLTSPCRADLAGGPNVWCPIAPDFDNAEAVKRRAAGDAFWLYVCMCPLAPYATLFIDHPGVEMRTWLWQSWARDVKGVLCWAVDYWNQPAVRPDPRRPLNPYADPMTWNGRGVGYGNGDGRFFYPPRSAFADPDSADGELSSAGPNFDRPVPCQRVELLRDGIEDYEYFAILKKADPGNPLLKVPAEVSRGFADFSTDPSALERHRARLAAAIERTRR